MKKKVFLGITAVVVVVVAFGIVFFAGRDNVSNCNVFSVHAEDEIKKLVEDENIKSYGFDDGYAYITELDLFGETADVEFYMTDGNITEIAASFTLFENFSKEMDGADEADVAVPELSESDKKKTEQAFETVKSGFCEYVGCTFESYDVIATYGSDNPEDSEENFFNGRFIKEYSVRDSNGVLWLMHYAADSTYASVNIYKLVDETGYDGFIAAVDLTKK